MAAPPSPPTAATREVVARLTSAEREAIAELIADLAHDRYVNQPRAHRPDPVVKSPQGRLGRRK